MAPLMMAVSFQSDGSCGVDDPEEGEMEALSPYPLLPLPAGIRSTEPEEFRLQLLFSGLI